VVKLGALLRLPSDSDRAALSRRLTIRAEAEYAAGRTENAYRTLNIALNAQPDNDRALNDLQIAALRTGRMGEALEASAAVIAKNSSPSLVADAWFNTGLACEGGPFVTYNRPVVTYNGEHYCDVSLIRPFLKAWQASPTMARADKVKQLFQSRSVQSCSVASDDAGKPPRLYHIANDQRADDGRYNPKQRIYVFHASDQTIDPNEIHLDMSDPTIIPSREIERYVLDEFAVTVLESEQTIRSPYFFVGAKQCGG
jgi:tetratricopeptide (TPR) repeat protein